MVDPHQTQPLPPPPDEPERRDTFDYRQLLDVIHTLFDDISEHRIVPYMLQTIRGALGCRSCALMLRRRVANGGGQSARHVAAGRFTTSTSQILRRIDPTRMGLDATEALVCVAARGHDVTPDLQFEVTDDLVDFLEENPDPTPVTIVRTVLEATDAARALERYNVDVVYPIVRRHRLMGLVLIGPPVTGQPYDAAAIEFGALLVSQFASSLHAAELLESAEQSRALAVEAARALREEQLRRRAFLRALGEELGDPLVVLREVERALDPTDGLATKLTGARQLLLGLFYDLTELARGDLRAMPADLLAEPGDVADAVERAGTILGIYLDAQPGIGFETEVPDGLPRVKLGAPLLRWLVFSLIEVVLSGMQDVTDLSVTVRNVPATRQVELAISARGADSIAVTGAIEAWADELEACATADPKTLLPVEHDIADGRLGWSIPRCVQAVRAAGGHIDLAEDEETSADSRRRVTMSIMLPADASA